MRKLPRIAQVYALLVIVAGIVSAAIVAWAPMPAEDGLHWELLLLLGAGLLAGSKKIVLFQSEAQEDSGSLSLGFALTFLVLLRFGPAGALAVGGANCLVVCRRQPIYQLIFNCALLAVEVAIGSQVFLWLNGGVLALDPVQSLPAVTVSALCFFAVNTVGVSTIIGLCARKPVRQIWKGSLLWTAPCYFASACVAAMAVRLIRQDVIGVIPFAIPALYMIYHSYAVFSAHNAEKQKNVEALASLFLETIESLALAIDAKDVHTHQHVRRVQRYALAMAQALGVDPGEMEAVRAGALLHDIGKLGVPEYILLKPGALTADEFEQVKRYPQIGAAILDKVHFPWPVMDAVRHHKERWDGSGYPQGMRGLEIPRVARILAVADVYDTLTSVRAYRPAWDYDAALAEIQRLSGRDFDPEVVDALARVVAPTLAQLRNDGLLQSPAPIPELARPGLRTDATREIQRASSELWALYEVAQGLSASRGIQETMSILSQKLAAILPTSTCLFLVRDSDQVRVRSAVGANAALFAGASSGPGPSLSRDATRSRQTYLGVYDPDDLHVPASNDAAWEPLRSALIVPIVYQDEVLGTINLYHTDPQAYSEHDRHLLERIVERAASALYTGLLFDQTRSDADTDPLTGLFNVRYTTDQIERRCRQTGSGAEFALVCLDLDSFKPINDNFGHQRGNVILKDFAALLQAHTRRDDVVARYGGDEFLVLLSGAHEEQAAALVERVHAAVDAYETGLSHPRLGTLRLGVSIGYACFPHDASDGAGLIAVADARMYAEKSERKLRRMTGNDDSAARRAA